MTPQYDATLPDGSRIKLLGMTLRDYFASRAMTSLLPSLQYQMAKVTYQIKERQNDRG